VDLTGKDLGDTAAGVGTLTASGIASLGDVVLTDITAAIQNVATMRANNGAEQSRLGFASEVLTVNKANLEAANSRIIDVDVAEESTRLARWNILVQSGTAMLSQANQSAQIALKLLG
jgi:flagellin